MAPLHDFVSALLRSLLYFFLYLYCFNLCNQYTTVEEDRINKPDRPIPSGLVSVEGARFRWYIMTALYLVTGLGIGNIWSCLLWIFAYSMYNFYGWSEHWVTKNGIVMPLGIVWYTVGLGGLLLPETSGLTKRVSYSLEWSHYMLLL